MVVRVGTFEATAAAAVRLAAYFRLLQSSPQHTMAQYVMSMLRVSKDGGKLEIFATGLRAA